MTARIFIDGQAGTTGLGIAERLGGIAAVSLHTLADADRKSAAARRDAMAACDLAILCLPDEAARESVQLAQDLGAAAPKLLDASTAHRTAPGWTYGFAELGPGQATRIAQARLVANPGCYATGAIALLRPLIARGLLPPDAPISINAVSGYSGGGNPMIAAHERDGGPAFELYGLRLDHKHLPEIMAHAGLTRRPIFVPSVAHMRQGMLVSIPLHLDRLGLSLAAVQDALAGFYAAGSQVRVMPATSAGTLQPDTLNGTDLMELAVFGAADHALLVARLDNLGKGASGAAVQNAILMLDLA